MKIVAEASVPFLRGVAEQYADIVYLDNPDIQPDSIQDADALIVRSITKCNEQLLAGSQVRYIATATAGADHIDANYCATHDIAWTNAPGCNARAVAQYVASALSLLCLRSSSTLEGKTIGIIGVGHVGTLVADLSLALGMKVLLNDPPRLLAEGDQLPNKELYTDLETIQREADIITLHVPLIKSGDYPTYHLVDESFISRCKQGITLINACRGAVCKTEALITAKLSGHIGQLVIDCWEGEPRINTALLELTDIATPHIAGFSADGKHRGARMALLAISDFFGLGASKSLLEPRELQAPQEPIRLDEYPVDKVIAFAQLQTFNPQAIDQALRQDTSSFEYLRKHYDYPREMSAYTVVGGKDSDRQRLSLLGFKLG